MEAQPLLSKSTCWSAGVHYPFITTPLLVAQNFARTQFLDAFFDIFEAHGERCGAWDLVVGGGEGVNFGAKIEKFRKF